MVRSMDDLLAYLREVRRHIRALAGPCAAATAAGAVCVTVAVPSRGWIIATLGEPAASTLRLGMIAVLLTCWLWLLWSVHRALTGPHRDRDAAGQLADLQMAAQEPGCVLVEISHTQWATGAGQRAWAIDSATGAVGDYWLPHAALPVGAFVLLRLAAGRLPEILGRLRPDEVQAALRHEAATAQRDLRRAASQRFRRNREEAAAIREVLHEAQRITRHG